MVLISSVLCALLVAYLFLAAAGSVEALASMGKKVWSSAQEEIPGLRENSVLDESVGSLLRPFIGLVEFELQSGSVRFGAWLKSTDAELTNAGLQTLWDPRIALAWRLLCATGAGTAAVALALLVAMRWPGTALVVLLLGMPVLAVYVFQNTFVPAIQARLDDIERQLPYVLEFLSMTMRANATIEQALAEYCRSSRRSDPLVREFRLVLRDQELGLGAGRAFSNLAARAPTPSVQLFVSAVEHGLEKGQSMVDVLSSQAQATRMTRYQAAERLAKDAGNKALIPLMLCLLSCLIAFVAPLLVNFSIARI